MSSLGFAYSLLLSTEIRGAKVMNNEIIIKNFALFIRKNLPLQPITIRTWWKDLNCLQPPLHKKC